MSGKLKIAICIPVHGGGRPQFIQSLANMVARTGDFRFRDGERDAAAELDTFVFSTSIVSYSRHRLVEIALDKGAEWLLWLDADQTFPRETLVRLLAHRQPIVGAAYRVRNPDKVLSTAHLDEAGKAPAVPTGSGLIEVASLGLGICLTRAEVFRKIGPPYFSMHTAKDGFPVGEDVTFCQRARAAGFRIFVDQDLSREVGHVAETVLTFPPPAEG